MSNPAGRLALLLLLVPAAIGTDPRARCRVQARLEPPAGQSAPRELTVRVRPSLELVGRENPAWEEVVACPIRSRGWTCEIPAGRVDLRITGAAIRPVYRWGVAARTGQTVDLGTLRLVRGASISGFVRPQGKIPQYSVQVDLMAERHARPWRTSTLESTSRPWGFFRFDGVPPGRYAVAVRDLNLPVLGAGPIVVAGDRPVELPKPLVLKRLSLFLRLTPAKDPYGWPWRAKLANRVAIPGEPLREGTAEESGEMTFRDLAPGDYSLSVLSGSRLRDASWETREIRLDETRSVEVRIPHTRIRGQVLYRELPLASSIRLSGDSSSFSFETDERGVFEGYVKQEESWNAQVSAKDPELLIHLQDPLRMPKGTSSWSMAVRVPDTRLAAEVVNSRGRRLSPATIQALGEIPNYFRQDDLAPGSRPYEIIGLRPGPQRLRGSGSDPFRQGEPVEVQLPEGRKGPHVRLVLPDVVDVRGRVLPRFGSPAGTRVFAWPVNPGEPSPGAGQTVGEDGELRLVLPGETRRVSLAVLPPGSSLRLLQTDASDGHRLEIPVRRAGGTLIVEGPGALVEVPEPKDSEPPRLSTAILLRKWADLQATPQSPGRLVVPNVEPGPYTLCPGDPFTLRRGPLKDGETGCVSGVLKAAGELTMVMP